MIGNSFYLTFMLNGELVFNSIVDELGAVLMDHVSDVLVFIDDFDSVVAQLDFGIGHGGVA
jgi:hypothetical protein